MSYIIDDKLMEALKDYLLSLKEVQILVALQNIKRIVKEKDEKR